MHRLACETMSNPALSFGQAATDYDRFRPTYPYDAVKWAIGGPPPRDVVDLGAGTGLLTRVALAAGYAVTPVEPDAGMRAQFAAATPDVATLAGSAESVPLPDHSVDAVISGQAYHWFDPDRAHAETARVLRPGGTFAALWNNRDEDEPWVAELTRIAAAYGDEPHPVPASFGDRFTPVEHRTFRHATTMTADEVVAMMTTRSYYLVAPPGRRRSFEAELRRLVGTHPDLAGRSSFPVPYRTEVYRASTLRS
jgi:SAM-dependent methyltransferase